METKKDLMFVTTFILISYVLGIYVGFHLKSLSDRTNEIEIKIIRPDTLSRENVYNYIIKSNIKHPEIVLKQSLLETGNYTSNVCKNYNNIFGFYYKGDYIKFDDWKDCIDYYRAWQERKYTNGDYYSFLKNLPYAEDSNYVWKLKQIKI
jgi:hypothetical protein